MPNRRRLKSRRPKLGPNIVRAWFDTVINPLLHSLTFERVSLLSRSWTWQFRLAVPPPLPNHETQGYRFGSPMETIQYASNYLEASGQQNIRQVLSLYPKVRKAVTIHDNNVTVLAEWCYVLHKALKESPDLRALYDRFTSPEHLSPEIGPGNIFGAYPKSDHLAVIAQYIVNNEGSLPAHFSTAVFWNPHRSDFMALLGKPEFQRPYQKTLEAGDVLLNTSIRLYNLLEVLRFTLSLEYDTPFVTAATSIQKVD